MTLSRIQKSLPLLKLLYKASPKMRKVILLQSGPDLMLSLCEIALNVLNGNIPLTSRQYDQLKKKKKQIRLIADKKVKIAKKNKLVNQSGGFLLPLLGAALPFVVDLVRGR